MSFQKIVISANFTIDPIIPSLERYLGLVGIPNEIHISPYNQIFQQLLDSSSQFHLNSRGVNVIFLRVEDLVEGRSLNPLRYADELDKIRSNAYEFNKCLQDAGPFAVPFFIFLCPRSGAIANDQAISIEFESIERSIMASIESVPDVHFYTMEHLDSRYKIVAFDNPKGNSLGHIPYSIEYYSAMGAELTRRIDSVFRKPYKVIVLDCDNTLWDGVCGEDGTEGIGFSEERIYLQEFMAKQSAAGRLICLCSKNNEADVWEVFDRRGEMRLKREHLVSSRINWEPKSSNLRSLADELKLGLDSFIFVDDDSAVCDEVRTNCPEVVTIQIPNDIAELPNFMEHLWVFDTSKVTEEDKGRTQSYQREIERDKLRSQTSNLSTFLANLRLVCDVAPITSAQIPRVSQLSSRTNQFNSTTIRWSESEIHEILKEKHILTVNVSDRFGDYGLVGALVYEETADSLNVISFMLSCRVLGRGVEHAILRALAGKGMELGMTYVSIEYRATPKNVPFLNFLTEIDEAEIVVVGDIVFYRFPVYAIDNARPRETSKACPLYYSESVETMPAEYNTEARDVYVEIANLLTDPRAKWSEQQREDVPRELLNSEFASAGTSTEMKLRDFWTQILRLKNIGIRDNFFDLGGDSLVAVSLFVEIENEFDVSLPVSALIDSPTIEKLAALIEQDSRSRSWKYLVPLKTDGTLRPLFCMHAAGGNVLFYRDLATELIPDQPVYGLQARGVANKEETAHDRVEEMVEEYLEEIRLVQPHGPYRLCGSSFGGLLAFEAARQLQQVGEEVDFISLFDTYAPGYLPAAERQIQDFGLESLPRRIRNLNNQLRELGNMRNRIDFMFTKAKQLKKRVERKVIWKMNQFDIQYAEKTGKDLPIDVQRNHKAIQRALKNYRPSPYDGPVILFRASEQPNKALFDPNLGWGEFTMREIISMEVMGTHGSLTVSPFASHLAEKFNPFLVEKQIRESSASGAATSSSWLQDTYR